MLIGEDRRGRENRHLLAVADGLERRADGDLGFAESDIAAHQAVHGVLGLHVFFGVLDGAPLIGRFLIGERRLELHLPGCILGEWMAGHNRPLGVEFQKFVGHIPR